MTMSTTAWLTCNHCGLVLGVGPFTDDDAVVDHLFDAAELAGWDATPLGPDACPQCKGKPEHRAAVDAVEHRVWLEAAGRCSDKSCPECHGSSCQDGAT